MFKYIGEVLHGTYTQLRSLVMVFSHAFRKRDTLQYPEEPVYLPPRYRGRIVLTRDPDGEERCVACNLCAVACPVGCISLQKAETEDGRWYPEFFRINFSRCIFCGLCEEACPTTAIQLTPDFEMGEYKRQDLVYEKEDLLISGPGKNPDYNFYRVSGLAIAGKPKGAAQQEAEPINVKGLLPCPYRRAPAPSARSPHGRATPQFRGPDVMEFAFYFSAGVAVVSTLRVVTGTNPVHALLYLVVSLLAVAMCFFSLGAPFAGALEIIVYAGAIMVLFVFVVMMLNLGPAIAQQERAWLTPRIWIGPSLLAGVLLLQLLWALFAEPSNAPLALTSVGPKEVGVSLFGPYLLAVELASLLLLAALIAAYHLGRHEAKE